MAPLFAVPPSPLAEPLLKTHPSTFVPPLRLFARKWAPRGIYLLFSVVCEIRQALRKHYRFWIVSAMRMNWKKRSPFVEGGPAATMRGGIDSAVGSMPWRQAFCMSNKRMISQTLSNALLCINCINKYAGNSGPNPWQFQRWVCKLAAEKKEEKLRPKAMICWISHHMPDFPKV